jgi:hypothetical protein
MKNKKRKNPVRQKTVRPAGRQRPAAGKPTKPVARWITDGSRRLLVLQNAFYSVTLWPEMGGAIAAYVDRASGIDIIWRNPYVQPPRSRVLDQPMAGGSDLYDVMDGSWYVSLPTGYFATSYFGAPIGTHGELRAVPWTVEEIKHTKTGLAVTLVGKSIRTPLVYRRTLTVGRTERLMRWTETVENRSAEALPVAWLQHPTFGGDLLDGARLITPAHTVRVFQAADPKALQLQAGYSGRWPFVPEREGGAMRDCSVVPPAGSGKDHSVQLTDFEAGWGCIWNERRQLGFAMEWELDKFPYAWSWNCAGGAAHYPMWGEGHIITLQPSTSPVGHFADLVKSGELMTVPAHGGVSTTLVTGFVHSVQGPWSRRENES